MRRKFKVELVRLGTVISSDYVLEFDDECVSANVFYDALELFEYYIQDGDIIRTAVGDTLIKYEDGEANYYCL